MNDSTPVLSAPKKKHRLLRAIAWLLGVLIVLLVAAFFVATSSSFLKGTILPRVSQAIDAQVTVSDASISPFKHVILRDLKVQTTGTEPLVTAAEVRLRYSLMDIIGGNIHVDEITVTSLTVALVENPDGSSNLDPILKSQTPKNSDKKTTAPAKNSTAKPLQIDLKKFAVTDATLRRIKNFADGTREVAEISHANLTLDSLKNGQTAQLVLGTDLNLLQTNATLQAKLAGTFTLALTPDLKPSLIKGNTRLDVTKAEGALADATTFGSAINVEITPSEIKEIALLFQRGNASLGELRVSGPLDIQKLEGRLNIVLAGIDKQLMNLVGASSGMDFGSTTISSKNEVELSKGGSMITAKGQLGVLGFQLTRLNQTTPQLDLRSEYDVTIDRNQNMATMRTLTMTGTQKGDALLKAELTTPIQISWGKASDAVGDSEFTLAVTDFNLADWKPFVGEVAPAGTVNMTAKVLSQQGGKQLTFGVDSKIEHLSVNAGSNHIADASVSLHANAKVTDLKQLNLTDCKLEVAHQNETLTTVTASGTYDTASGAADLQVAAQASLAALLRTLPQPGMTVASGTVELKAHITQQDKAQAVTGNFALADFSGKFGANEIGGLGTTMEFDVGMASQRVQVRQLQISLTPTARATNKLQLTGQVDMSKSDAIQGEFKLAADSLDFTSYYDLFMSGKQQAVASTPTAEPMPTPEPVDANKEPDPIMLPFSTFTFETSIGRLYLHDIDIADWQTTTKINGGHVTVNPFKLTLNGAPVNTTVDLDLGLPGWKYDLSFSALAVPLTPLLDSFQPDSKGQMGGTMTAQGQISGAGITGTSLQKNLNGQFDINTTNLNLNADNIKNPILKSLVKVVSDIPGLLQSPKGKLGSLLGGLTGKQAPSNGEVADLPQSPINAIIVQGTAGAGRIELQKAMVQSPNFQADVDGGAVMLAPVITNSTLQIPVSISLSQPAAQKIGLVNESTPTNAPFVKVPDFLTLTGTVGVPKPEVNYVALAGTVTGAVKGLRDSIREARGSTKGDQQPDATTTNQPPAAEPKLENLIQGLFGPKKKKK